MTKGFEERVELEVGSRILGTLNHPLDEFFLRLVQKVGTFFEGRSPKYPVCQRSSSGAHPLRSAWVKASGIRR